MCLGIPGRITGFVDGNDQLARVDVIGVDREINIGMIRGDGPEVGDWVLIHIGSALSIIDEEGAALALQGLRMVGAGPDAVAQAQTEPPPPPPAVRGWDDY